MNSNDDISSQFKKLKLIISQEREILEQIKKERTDSRKKFLLAKISKINDSLPDVLNGISMAKKLSSPISEISGKTIKSEYKIDDIKEKPKIRYERYDDFENKNTKNASKVDLEKEFGSEFSRKTLKRIKRGEKKEEEKKEKYANKYVMVANSIFSGISIKLLEKKIFRNLQRDLVRANLEFLPKSYVSVILFTSLLSFIFSIFLFIFLMFFNIGASWPIITSVTGSFSLRFLKVFWILFAIPLITSLFLYIYPYLEKRSAESRIDQELPFVAIHLSAISGAMVEPSRLFKIIVSTKEYPYIGREFIKLLNKINIYGYNIVGALRDSSFNSPSKRLAELFNGLATTITSGGDLQTFFEKRAQTLLFDYRLARERYTRAAETYMDIYISVVIAAPMIFMLLLIIIKVSGLGISLSTSAITLIMILGVSIINVIFLVFLSLNQPTD